MGIQQGVRQSVDCPATELRIEREAQGHLGILNRYLERRWKSRCRGTHLVKSASRDMEDLVLIIDAERNSRPTVQDLADLVALHCRLQRDHIQRVLLFLHVGSIAFPLIPEIPRDLHRWLLTPATAPDVFLQLGERRVYWTDYTRWYLADWQTNEQWLDASYEKMSQLDIIAESAKKGHVVYPLTPESLERQKNRADP